MAEQTEVKLDSKHRVALELMERIVDREDEEQIERPDARTYYLTLYRQCYKAVSGNALDSILQKT